MRTTKKDGIARILVRIHAQDRTDKVEKKITTTDGRQLTLYLVAPEYQEVNKFDLSVRIGTVEGVGPGVGDLQIGDQVLLDYVVDTDDAYLVEMDGKDKILSVPCCTTYHVNSQMVTSYGHRFGEDKFKYTGERNMLIWEKGDVDQLGMVFGILRDDQLIPSDYWVFCDHRPERTQEMELAGGVFAHRELDHTYVRRTVQFAAPGAPYQAGDEIMAVPGAAVHLQVLNLNFDIIAKPDIFAIELSSKSVL